MIAQLFSQFLKINVCNTVGNDKNLCMTQLTLMRNVVNCRLECTLKCCAISNGIDVHDVAYKLVKARKISRRQ